MTILRAGAATDVGRVRQINEDRFLSEEHIYAVADGVGGHQAGEVAAQTSVDTLRSSFTEHTTMGLRSAVERANRAVWQLAHENAEKRGMGTTITAVALVVDEGDEQLAVANVGDSRAYLLQGGELLQVSEDHSLVEEMVREGQISPEEALVHPQRSIITRALGMEPEVEVDSWQLTPHAGDRILLCSDGLTNELPDERIASILRRLSDPQDAAKELVREARAAGGGDNITAVVVDVVDDGGRSRAASDALERTTVGTPVPTRPRRPPTPDPWHDMQSDDITGLRAAPGPPPAASEERAKVLFTWRTAAFTVLVLTVLGVALAAISWYARSTYFVGLSDGRVAIFRGRPGGVLWLSPTLEDQKSLTIEEVPAVYRRDVRAGYEVASKADGDRYVNRLRQQAAATSTTTTTAPTSTTLPDQAPPTTAAL